jgi:hypothetical protein
VVSVPHRAVAAVGTVYVGMIAVRGARHRPHGPPAHGLGQAALPKCGE